MSMTALAETDFDVEVFDLELLRGYENVIENGKKAFLDMGDALNAIKEKKLYRTEYSSFENYCRERWGFSRSYAFRLIEASETVKTLPMGNTLPENERVCRPLNKVSPEDAPRVWKEAQRKAKVAGRAVSHKDVEAAVQDITDAEFTELTEDNTKIIQVENSFPPEKAFVTPLMNFNPYLGAMQDLMLQIVRNIAKGEHSKVLQMSGWMQDNFSMNQKLFTDLMDTYSAMSPEERLKVQKELKLERRIQA